MNDYKIPFFDPFSFDTTGVNKNSIGYDEILKQLRKLTTDQPKFNSTYPPYNIRKVEENKYVIELAVAGFGSQDIEVEVEGNTLVIRGKLNTETIPTENYIFKGIADRAFTRTFTIADSVVIRNADLINGMLKVWLERFIPEAKKPQKININEPSDKTSDSTKQFISEKYEK